MLRSASLREKCARIAILERRRCTDEYRRVPERAFAGGQHLFRIVGATEEQSSSNRPANRAARDAVSIRATQLNDCRVNGEKSRGVSARAGSSGREASCIPASSMPSNLGRFLAYPLLGNALPTFSYADSRVFPDFIRRAVPSTVPRGLYPWLRDNRSGNDGRETSAIPIAV